MAIIPKARIGAVGQNVSRTSGQAFSGVQKEAGDFGTGEGFKTAGKIIRDFSGQQLDRMNETALRDASNKFKTDAMAINLRAKQLQGTNATKALEQATKELEASANKISGELSSPAQRKMFNVVSTRTAMTSLNQVEAHAIKEGFKAEADSKDAAKLIASRETIAAITSPNFSNIAAENLEIVRKNSYNDGDPQKVKDWKSEVATENYHYEVMKGLSDVDNNLALGYLEINKKDFKPGVYASLRDTYKAGATRDNSLANAKAWFKLPQEEINKNLLGITDKKEYTESKKLIKSFQESEALVKEQAHDKKVVEVNQAIVKDPFTPSPTGPEYTVEDHSSFDKIRSVGMKNGYIPTQKAAVVEIERMKSLEPEKYFKLKIAKDYSSKIGPDKVDTLVKEQLKWKANNGVTSDAKFKTSLELAFGSRGIGRDSGDQSKTDFNDRYYDALMAYKEGIIELSKHKFVTDKDRDQMAASVIITTLDDADTTGWWDSDVVLTEVEDSALKVIGKKPKGYSSDWQYKGWGFINADGDKFHMNGDVMHEEK